MPLFETLSRFLPVVLLVDADVNEADRIARHLSDDPNPPLVLHERLVDDAARRLQVEAIDVVVIALSAMTEDGVRMVERVRKGDADVPVLVTLDSIDKARALNFLRAGADDWVLNSGARTTDLRGAIDRAIWRHHALLARGARELADWVSQLSLPLLEDRSGSRVIGVGPLRAREPQLFARLQLEYQESASEYVEFQSTGDSRPSRRLERLASSLSKANAGVRDLLEIHSATLDLNSTLSARSRLALLSRGRMLVLELIGLLMDEYRETSNGGARTQT